MISFFQAVGRSSGGVVQGHGNRTERVAVLGFFNAFSSPEAERAIPVSRTRMGRAVRAMPGRRVYLGCCGLRNRDPRSRSACLATRW